MKPKHHKPFKILWFAIPLLLAITAFSGRNNVIDLLIGTSLYIVVSNVYFAFYVSIYFAFSGWLYWLNRNIQLINWMTIIHVVFSVGTIVLILTFEPLSKRILNMDAWGNSFFDSFLVLNLLIFLFLQVIFFLNLTISHFYKKNRKEI